jgi:hypothetical protein
MQLDKILRPDSKTRITLGELAKGISGFKVMVDEQTQAITLLPYKEVPVKEHWLFENPQALESVKRGLQQSATGQVVKRGSFAGHIVEKN